MKKQPQQPSMDEWLLDPIHGLEAGDEDNVQQPITPSDFLTPEALNVFLVFSQNAQPITLSVK